MHMAAAYTHMGTAHDSRASLGFVHFQVVLTGVSDALVVLLLDGSLISLA